MGKVTVIEPIVNPFSHKQIKAFQRRKVAAYARVSTDSSEQLTSYAAQVKYYKEYILAHPEWEYAGIYADAGISGLKTSNRTAFSEMIEDAKAGKIDLILTKSVSRFARNTVDSLVNIRLLKEYGTEVYFEKENIWTFDSKGEVLLTIMSSLAQEESRSLSENVAWGYRKRFADGKFSLAYSCFLGYDKGPDGGLVVNKEEAKIVRLIYRMFMDGYSAGRISKEMGKRKIPTPRGFHKWAPSVVLSILSNEKYKGDALLQKSFTADFLTKRHKKNEGELPMYYLENNHEGIVTEDDWGLVHDELERRSQFKKSYCCVCELSCKIICGNCGGYYGPKVIHSTDKYRKIRWRCNKKYSGKDVCTNPMIAEEIVRSKFLQAYDEYIGNRNALIEDAELMLSAIPSGDHRAEIEQYISELHKQQHILPEWNPKLWSDLIEKAVVQKDKSITFCFKTGKEITI